MGLVTQRVEGEDREFIKKGGSYGSIWDKSSEISEARNA